jgi:LacI family transcriptional regulator
LGKSNDNRMNSVEIARLAGVSRSTVSRVINRYRNVPDSTRTAVMSVVEKYGYYPSFSGRVLAGKRTGMIALVWVLHGSIAYDIQASSFMVHVIESAAAHGYLVLNCVVPNLREKNSIDRVKKIFLQGQVDAGIFIGTNNSEPVVEDLINRNVVLGIMDHICSGGTDPNCITVNFETDTGERVIDYVYGKGHRKIAIIDGNMNRYSSVCRHEGFVRGMQKNNIEIRYEWMRYGDVIEEGGYMATKELLNSTKELPTVICANNDSTAFGVYRALGEAGINIPGMISVVGIDGHERANMLQPELTTFGFDFKEMFESLVARTIATARGETGIVMNEYIFSKLIERSSCRELGK